VLHPRRPPADWLRYLRGNSQPRDDSYVTTASLRFPVGDTTPFGLYWSAHEPHVPAPSVAPFVVIGNLKGKFRPYIT
jgi:hypothetical protein